MPSFQTVAPMALGAHQMLNLNCEFAVFIGPQKSFTKTVMRNVEEEVEDVQPVRFETVSDYRESVGSGETPARIIVVDAAIYDTALADLQEMTQAQNDQSQAVEPPGVVVAYWHDNCARAVLDSLGGSGGLQGFLPMNQSIDIWLAVFRLLLSGGSYFPPEVMEVEHDESSAPPETVNAPTREVVQDLLTRREVAVMEHVANGLQNKQIAAELDVSEHTIKLHIHHIITKLKVSNRTAAAMKFMEVMHT